jgi:hypothetical protein
MTTRKTYLGVLVAVLVLTAGCSGLLGGDQSFEASDVSVSGDALPETGYENVEDREYMFNETVNNDTEVSITSNLAGYEKAYDNGSGYVVALATPKAAVAGVDVNPLGSADKKRLVAEAMSRSGKAGIDVSEDDLEAVGNTSVTTLDTDATATTYEATVERSGTERDVLIHAVRVEHGDDYVIGVGVHPEAADDGEGDVITLLEGIEHETDE